MMRIAHSPLSLLAAAVIVTGSVHAGRASEGPDGALRAASNQLTELLSAPDSVRQARLGALLDQWVDWQGLTHDMFGEYVRQSLHDYTRALSDEHVNLLVAHREKHLARAVRQRMERDLAQLLKQRSIRAVHVLERHAQDHRGSVNLLLLGPGAQIEVQGLLARKDTTWRLLEVRWGKKGLRDHYQHLFSRILRERYSTSTLEAALLGRPYVVLDDFSDTPPGRVPLDWGIWRDKDKDKPLPYHVAVQDGHSYLAAADSGQSVILGKFERWNPRTHPIMTWCWRVHALPPGGNELRNDLNDSAAGIYVIFSQNWLGVPKQLKYVWSSTLPRGTVGRRNLLFRPWFFVLESGPDKVGRWVFEQVDLAAHHKLKLGGRPPRRTIGLGILTDANSTASYAAADYADFRVWTRAALTAGQIDDYCDCLNRATDLSRPTAPLLEKSP